MYIIPSIKKKGSMICYKANDKPQPIVGHSIREKKGTMCTTGNIFTG